MSVPLGTFTLVITVISGSSAGARLFWCNTGLCCCTPATAGTACRDSSFGMSTHVSIALTNRGLLGPCVAAQQQTTFSVGTDEEPQTTPVLHGRSKARRRCMIARAAADGGGDNDSRS